MGKISSKAMPMFVSFLMILVASELCHAQDIIVKTDGKSIEAIVSEVSETTIKYYRYSNPQGPLYSLPISSVSLIKYKNGTVEEFNDVHLQSSEIKSVDQVHQPSKLTDDQLLKLYRGDDITTSSYHYDRAAHLKKVGKIGAFIIAGVGIAAGVGVGYYKYDSGADNGWSTFLPIIAGGSVVCAGAWYGFHAIKARAHLEKAREIDMYSAALFNMGSFSFDDKKSMIVSVDLISQTFHDFSNKVLGIGFRYKF